MLHNTRRRKMLIAYCLRHLNYYPNDFYSRERVVWRFPRHQLEFDDHLDGSIPNPDYWKSKFRMTRFTFMKIVELVKPILAPKPNFVRKPVSLEKRVAVGLNWLATGNSYHSVGQAFGVSKPAVVKFVRLFIRAMYSKKK